MVSMSINPSQFPEYIYGVHDIGGQAPMLKMDRIGWLLDSVDLCSQVGADYTRLTKAGLGVIVQLNYSCDGAGTIPPSDQYAAFAEQCAVCVANSPGPRIWIIGNELNSQAQRPVLPDGSLEVVTPELAALSFFQCRNAIKQLPGHADDWVIPGAVAPNNDDTGDWLEYFVDLYNLLYDEVDGIALHCFTHDLSTAQIVSDIVMDPPFDRHHSDFRSYRDFLNVLPERFRSLPVFITQAGPTGGWENSNSGWIQAAYREIDEWNSDPAHQPIQAMMLSRWLGRPDQPKWGIQDKPNLIDDLSAALLVGYRVRWTPPEPTLVQESVISQPALVHESTLDQPALIQEPVLTQPGPTILPYERLLEPATESTGAPVSVSVETEYDPVALANIYAPLPDAAARVQSSVQSPKRVFVPSVDQWATQFLAHDTPVAMVVGQTVAVNLRLKNIGASTWPQAGDLTVHVGYKWFDSAGKQRSDSHERRTALPGEIVTGEECTFGAILVAPQAPGSYTLQWDLVVEGSHWFADAGSAPLAIPVRVTTVPRDMTGWRVEASENPSQVAHSLDGDPTTFWDSGVPQRLGQWFRLNLSSPRLVDGIQFLSPGKGYPASHILRISADGKTWHELARATLDEIHDLMVVFAPMQMQYAQIDLIASAPMDSSWMISEILIHSAAAWTANASQNPSAAGNAIDNCAETAWTSSREQAPGMWFQVDLGRAEVISGLALVAPLNENPIGFQVTIWDAKANRWQVVSEKRDNADPVDITFSPVQSQFINIQLTQASNQVWTIQNVRVVREMESWLGPTP
jgi:hypothetical protein